MSSLVCRAQFASGDRGSALQFRDRTPEAPRVRSAPRSAGGFERGEGGSSAPTAAVWNGAFTSRLDVQNVAPSGTRIISTRRPCFPASLFFRTSTREVSTLFFSFRYFLALSARSVASFWKRRSLGSA